ERVIKAVNSESDDPGESGSDTETGSDNDSENIETTFGRPFSSKDDRHASGQQLLRRMLESTGLLKDAIETVIGSMSAETWRKRRAGIHILNELMLDENLSLEQMKGMRADVILVNALTWRNIKGGTKCLQDLRKLKMHGGIALGMLFDTEDVSKHPLVNATAKRFEFAIQNKSKYTTMWDLDILLSHILKQEQTSDDKLMDRTMATFVVFTAARMTELTRMTIGETIIDGNEMKVRIKVKKGENEIEYEVQVNKQRGPISPVRAMEEWMASKNCLKMKQDAGILDEKGIEQQYGDATIRHAMVTKLRKHGAEQEEGNAFTRYAPGSNVVDVYYNKQIVRDLSILLLLGGDF
ncbi:MAG: hypothetical protein EZS28_036891, partial [Streblomastix strix]